MSFEAVTMKRAGQPASAAFIVFYFDYSSALSLLLPHVSRFCFHRISQSGFLLIVIALN